MPVETAATINQLNDSYPLATDEFNETDDHLRLIKATILQTFPSITGAVTSTHTDLNAIGTINTRLGTIDTDIGTINTAIGTIDTDIGTINSDIGTINSHLGTLDTEVGAIHSVPSGAIMLWFGASTAVPSGWQICDGTNGSPNMGTALPLGITAGTPGTTASLVSGSGGTIALVSFFYIMKL